MPPDATPARNPADGFKLEPFVRKVDDRLFPPPEEAALPATYRVELADSQDRIEVPTDLLGAWISFWTFSWGLGPCRRAHG